MLHHKNNFLLLFFSLCLSGQTINAEYHWEEAFAALGISWNPNGTLHREIWVPMVPPTPSDAGINPPPVALSRDIHIDNHTCARIYIPVRPPNPNIQKLPLIIYVHGGDFVLYSASTVIYHDFANDITARLPAVVVSVEYRLAPEHRLPAAYHDALKVILWAKQQALASVGRRDPGMEYADFSRVYLLGSSSGGNIAFHAALQALDHDIRPLQIRGLLMNQAYFGGVQRTPSELRLENDTHVALYINDVLWTLALPPWGADRDHPFCNPISGGTFGGRLSRLPKVYIKGDFGDPLVDRSIRLAQFLHVNGVPVFYRFNPGGYHGIELTNRTVAEELYNDIRFFVNDLHGNLRSGDVSRFAAF